MSDEPLDFAADSATLGATEAGLHPRPGHLTQTLAKEAPMPSPASTAAVDRVSTHASNIGAHALASKARKAAALRARARRLTAELEARAHEAVADFIHAELIGVEMRLLRMKGRHG